MPVTSEEDDGTPGPSEDDESMGCAPTLGPTLQVRGLPHLCEHVPGGGDDGSCCCILSGSF